ALKCKVLAHSGGSLLARERAELNISRTTLACLAGVFGGIQLIGLRTMDELFGIPTEKSEMIAIGTQHVVAYETGIPDIVDPLGGSYCVEALTTGFECEVRAELARIDEMGGMVAAIQSGYVRRSIAADAYQTHQDWQSGKKVKVGVNKFRIEEDEPPRRPYIFEAEQQQRQIEAVRQLRCERDNDRVKAALETVRTMALRPAGSETNLVPPIIEAVRAYTTVGEICGVLRDVFGEYTEPTDF
ncbi:MAG: hypothetical protein K8F31_12415, partial [Roseovarius sp.]|nr:hypothetical protein [Roseovarius sp.]